MINYKIQGIDLIVKKFHDLRADLPKDVVFKAVKLAAEPMKDAIQREYESDGLVMTGSLKRSISIYKRKRRSPSDGWFTYYIGPQYNKSSRSKNDKNRNFGNHAHFFEYGVPFSSYPIKGQGKSIGGRKYGKYTEKSGWRIAPIGTIRKAYDKNKSKIEAILYKNVFSSILYEFEQRGFRTFKK